MLCVFIWKNGGKIFIDRANLYKIKQHASFKDKCVTEVIRKSRGVTPGSWPNLPSGLGLSIFYPKLDNPAFF